MLLPMRRNSEIARSSFSLSKDGRRFVRGVALAKPEARKNPAALTPAAAAFSISSAYSSGVNAVLTIWVRLRFWLLLIASPVLCVFFFSCFLPFSCVVFSIEHGAQFQGVHGGRLAPLSSSGRGTRPQLAYSADSQKYIILTVIPQSKSTD